MTSREFQDYQGRYIDIYQQISTKIEKEKVDILSDIVFEIELVKQVEVGIDYVIELVIKYHESNYTDKTILGDIEKAIASSIELRSKKELIDGFVNKMNVKTNVSEDFDKYVKEQRDKDLEAIIETHSLKPQETKKFIENALQDGMIKTFGINIDKILPPASLFDNSRQLKKQQVVETIQNFFDKYVGFF